MKKQLLAIIMAVAMLITLLPASVYAAVPQGQRPLNPAKNLVIGILNDSRAANPDAFPNEPSVTGYDYYYLQDDLSLDTNWFRANFTNDASSLIDFDAFWNDSRIVRNGNAYGYYNANGLNLAEDSFFQDGITSTLVESTIITNWMSAQGIRGSADDYKLLFYVFKYEIGASSGYHLDAKVVKKTNLTLSYDANKPAGVTVNILLPSSHSVESGTNVTVEDLDGDYKLVSDGTTNYEFTGWNTAPDGSGTDYDATDVVNVTANTVLYAQWKGINTYTVQWLNYNDAVLYEDTYNHGDQVNASDYAEIPTRLNDSYYTYTFSHWELDANSNYDPEAGITEDLIFRAIYTPTQITFTARVEVVVNGSFDANGEPNPYNQGYHRSIEDVTDADGFVYLKKTDGTGDYIPLPETTNGVYEKDGMEIGNYYIYRYDGSEYIQIGTQELTIANANRTRYLPFYSVEYYDGVSSSAIITEYYYIGSAVTVTDSVPHRDGYFFTGWEDAEGNPYNSSTALLPVALTGSIVAPYELTAQWVDAAYVNVTVVVDHNDRELSEIDADLSVHLTQENPETGNYNEVNNTKHTYTSAEWYEGGTTEGDVTTFEIGTLYTDLNPNFNYGADAAIEGYRSDTDRPGGSIEITQNGNEYDVTVYLIYDPAGYELEFSVIVDDTVAERLVPVAVDVKVTRWNGSEWEVIPQHLTQSVEVEIDPATRQGTGKVHVWGFDGSDPYLYRIHVVRVDLGDYQLTVGASADDENYASLEAGFFPAGAYSAVVTVDECHMDPPDGTLHGAHALQNPDGTIEHHANLYATIFADPYTISLDPNGGKWSNDSTAPEEIIDRFTVPALSGYIPTRDGYTFDGWTLTDGTTAVSQGDYISSYVSTPGGTLELIARWKPNITVKGDIYVNLCYPCTDINRTVMVALHMWKEGGSYDVTVATETVSLLPVSDTTFAIGSYAFTDVPADNHYRVMVIVPSGSGAVYYQNETTDTMGSDPYDMFNYNDTDFEAIDVDSNQEAVVNVCMEATRFNLGYRADTSAIAEDYRPTDLALDLRHDHRDGDTITYEVIKNDLAINTFTDGVSPISKIWVPVNHANGYLYNYVISVLNYDIDNPAMVNDGNGWNDRHYYHYNTTDGYFPAPFSITYTGPAESSNVQNSDGLWQDVTLVATFTPNTYTIHYNLDNGTWASVSQIGPTHHKWSFDTAIPDPIRPGYIFTGWTAEVDGTYDSVNQKIPANVWQNVTLTANWKLDQWSDGDPDEQNIGDDIPDEEQIMVMYFSNNPEYGIVDKDFEIFTLDETGNVAISANATLLAEDCEFVEWKLSDTQVATTESLSYTIENAEGGQVYQFVAYFAPIDNWKDGDPDEETGGDGIPDSSQVKVVYTSTNPEYGTVDKTFEIFTLDETGNVDISATATANAGYRFVAWALDGVGLSAPASLTHTIENAVGGTTYNVTASFTTSGGGGGVTTYALTYDTNGGNTISKEFYASGTKVQLDKVPQKEGYIFDGWHLDEDLTEDVLEVTMRKNTTVYAAWIEDNGNAGNGHETPGALNGEDHFAYIQGYPDGTVGPNLNITRAEVATIFFRLLDPDVREQYLTTTNHFVDVNKYDWYNTAVSTLVAMDIIEGRDQNFFDGNAPITRAEFAAICARFDDSEYQISDRFSDIFGHWAEDDIHEAAAHGWIRGYDDGTFHPDTDITRAEAMTMINRVLNRIPENNGDLLEDMVIWPDNTDEDIWYYLPIQEATNSHEYTMKNHIYETWTVLTQAPDWSQYE